MAIAFDAGGICPAGNTAATDVVTTINNPNITSASNPWVATDVGRRIRVATGTPVSTFIASYVDAGHVTTSDNMTGTNSGITATWFNGWFAYDGTNVSTLTARHTTSGTNRYLVVKVWHKITDANYNLAATYNSQAMTLIHNHYSSSTLGVSLFGLALDGVVAAGTYDVVVYDTTVTARQFAFTCESYTGVHQTTPTGTPVDTSGAGGGSTTASLTVSASTGDLCVDVLGLNYKTTTTTITGSNQTMRSGLKPSTNFGPSGGWIIGCSKPGEASTVFSYDFNQTEYWSLLGVPLKPAADAGGGLMWL